MVQTLDDRHHLHVSVNLIIVAGNGSSSKVIAFRTLRNAWGFANRRRRRGLLLEDLTEEGVLRSGWSRLRGWWGVFGPPDNFL